MREERERKRKQEHTEKEKQKGEKIVSCIFCLYHLFFFVFMSPISHFLTLACLPAPRPFSFPVSVLSFHFLSECLPLFSFSS